jgi:hypothetical protein
MTPCAAHYGIHGHLISYDRVHKAQRDVHRAARTRVRTRDLDLIQHNDLQPEEREKLENQPIDEEKPGLGQHVSLLPLNSSPTKKIF